MVAMVAVLASACGDPDPDRVPGPNLLEDAAPETVAEIDVSSAGFDPDEVTVDAGQAIELTNTGDEDVRAVGRLGSERRFDTGTLRSDDTTTIAFEQAGDYRFTLDVAGETTDATLDVTVTAPPDNP